MGTPEGRVPLESSASPNRETGDTSPGPMAVLRIEVVDVAAGGPAPGVEVRLRDISQGWPWPDVARDETGADGRLRLEMPAGRRLALQVDPGPERMPVFRILDPVAAGEELPVSVRLHSMPVFRAVVAVVDESGEPVPGARIKPRQEGVFDPVRTGPDGRAELSRIANTWGTFLRVEKDGYAASFAVLLADDPDELVVVLRREAVLAGVVRLADGRPAAGARLEVRAPAGPLRFPVDRSPSLWRATADQDGHYRIPGLARETWLWLLAESGEASHAVALEALPAGETRLDLVLHARPVLRGTVVDGTGRPVAGVRLDLQPLPLAGAELEPWRAGALRLDLERRRTVTDEQGRFVFGREARLHPGVWEVGLAGSLDLDRLARPGAEAGPTYAWLPVKEEVEIAPGQAEAEVLLTVSRGLSLRGFLLDPDRRPLTSGTVRAYAEDDDVHCHVETRVLGADGSFVLEPLAPGTYVVHGGDPDLGLAAELDGVAAGSEGVTLVCRRPVRLRGRVVDAQGQGRYAEVFALVQGEGEGGIFGAVADGDGFFTLELNESATVNLLAYTGDGLAAVLSGVEVRGGEDQEVLLRLEPAARVDVELPDLSGLDDGGLLVEVQHRGIPLFVAHPFFVSGLHWFPEGELSVRLLRGAEVVASVSGILLRGPEIRMVLEMAGSDDPGRER